MALKKNKSRTPFSKEGLLIGGYAYIIMGSFTLAERCDILRPYSSWIKFPLLPLSNNPAVSDNLFELFETSGDVDIHRS